MPKPGEHKTVQQRILEYAKEIGWTVLTQSEAEELRGFDRSLSPKEATKAASLFFEDELFEKAREFNPKYAETKEVLSAHLQSFATDIYGNRDFLDALRNKGKFFVADENRELDLKLIEYSDIHLEPGERQNTYHVTEEFAFNNGQYGNREDVVFLINGIPVLVIECKNANKDEAIAIGVDQLRRYHDETPEMMLPHQLFTVTEAIGFSYGVTWNMVRRNISNWKDEEVGNLETKIKSYCDIPHILKLLKDYIVFAEKEEELGKYILRQHQARAVEAVVDRSLDQEKTRGLVWHTQGSGKTCLLYTSDAADE